MYNPQYLQRTYVIALTKMDLPGAVERADAFEAALRDDLRDASHDSSSAELQEDADTEELPPPPPPVAVIRVSAVNGTGILELSELLGKLAAEKRDSDDLGTDRLP